MTKPKKSASRPKSRMLTKNSTSPIAAADHRNDISKQAIDLLVQIVRGDLIKEKEGKIIQPSIAQRLAAAQMLLRIKGSANDSSNDNVKHPVHMDLPKRSQNFDEWLQRMQAMQTAAGG